RRPGVALSLVAATFVAVLPLAAAPVFLGTAESATINSQLADGCPSSGGAVVTSQMYSNDLNASHQEFDAVGSILASVPNLGPMQKTLRETGAYVQGLPKDNPATHPWFITVMARDGFQDHVQVLHKADVPQHMSVYVPDDIASAWKVGAGDTISITSDG